MSDTPISGELFHRYVSDPHNDGSYELQLGPASTHNFFKDIEELEHENNQLRAQLAEARRAIDLAGQCAQWHLGDGDECGEIARKAIDAINAISYQAP